MDFIQRRLAAGGGVEQAGVATSAGANRFEGYRVHPALAPVSHEQRGQHGFADAGVGAGEEDGARSHFGNIKAETPAASH